MEVKKMQINKTFFKSGHEVDYKKDEKEKNVKKAEQTQKKDRVEISRQVEKPALTEENNEENSYIQLQYAEYKIKENPMEALAVYGSISKERVLGLI